MKIAIISSGFLPVVDGVTVAVYQRLRSLSQLGHDVLVICPDYRSLESIYPHWRNHVGEILPGVRVVSVPSEPFMGVEFERNFSRSANPIIQRELEAFQPEVIHVDEPDRLFLGTLNAPGVAYAKRAEIPCVGFYHTNFVDYIEDFFPVPPLILTIMQWISTQIIRRVFQSYDVTLVSSSITERRVHQLGIRNTVCDRFLGVDIQSFAKQERDRHFFQTHYDIAGLEDKVKLIFLGRLTPDKGWGFTLRAFAHWVEQFPKSQDNQENWLTEVAIVVAGDGELRDEIRDRLRSLGLTVHLLGRIAPDAVPSLLVNSDIHVTASEKETLGLTVLESFAAGIPVLAPRAGGVVTLIRHEENGLLFAPQDVEDWGRSLHRLVTDAQLRQNLGQKGQNDAATYEWDAAVTTLLQVWQTQMTLADDQLEIN